MSNGKKILLVEDETAMLRPLSDVFKSEGFEVLTAKNGQEGLEKAIREKPDIILLDIIMPILDGIGMLAKLRQDPWGKSVPVFMLTNLSDSEKASEANKYQIAGYMVKANWKLEDLVAKVKYELKMA